MTSIDDFYVDDLNGKKYLYLPDEFNESLADIIFHSELYCIFFGEHFNQPLDNVIWPQKLISLYFGFDFNQPLDNVNFPDSLLTLSLLGSFNQPIDNIKILDTIEVIELGHVFDQSLANIKFSNLQMITLGNNNILTTFKFPPLLETIKFSGCFTNSFSDIILPETIKHIIFNEMSSMLFDFDKINFQKSLKKLVLPLEKITMVNIQKLHVTKNGDYYWNNLNNLPNTLEELTVGRVHENITNLPLSLKKIFTINTQSNLSHFEKLPFECKLYDVYAKSEIDTDK